MILKPKPKLVLGTAQFGLNYGVTNHAGMPSLEKTRNILEAASKHSILALDTAHAYGESEARIGLLAGRWSCLEEPVSAIRNPRTPFPFQTITKLDPLSGINESNSEELAKAACRSLEISCRTLALAEPNCILLHRPEQHRMAGGVVWDVLKKWRDEGLDRKIGISLSTPEELVDALKDDDVGHVQFPYNCLDYRWEQESIQTALANRPDVVVHVRSVLLQGLLAVQSVDEIAAVLDKKHADAIFKFVIAVRNLTDSSSRVNGAIAYAASQDWINGLVIGVGSINELDEVQQASRVKLDRHILEQIRQIRPYLDDTILNPAHWFAGQK